MEALVIRAQGGDVAAFEELAMHHATDLHRLAAAIVGPDDAADVAQEVLVQGWRELPRLRDPSRFTAWLRRIAVNQCRMALRARGRRPATVELGRLDPPAIGDASTAVAERDALDRRFETLPADVRAVLALHYVADLSLPAVADTLGIPTGTVKSRLNAGLRALRARAATESDR